MITLKDLIFALSGYQGEIPDITLTSSTIDSREVISGSMFIALPGEHVDGHTFVSQAFQQGALISLIEKDLQADFPIIDIKSFEENESPINFPPIPFCLKVENTLFALQKIAHYWRRNLPLRVIAITGSVGKSTTKELVAEVLSQKYVTFKNPGNYNNEIGLPLTIINLSKGYQRVVLEMGFYVPGEIKFLCDIALPDVGIVTNVGTVHAERAGSQAEIAKGKAELVAVLPDAPSGIAILNYDDSLVRAMQKKTKAKVITYGLNPHADLWADHIKSHALEGIEFRFHYKGMEKKVSTPLLGKHSVMTALRAIGTGLAEGMNVDEISSGLLQANSNLRMKASRMKSGTLILDDTYNATPESTMAALDLLAELEGKKIGILGDMLELGKYELAGHQMVGKHAASILDSLISVGVRGKIISDMAIAEGLPSDQVTWVGDTQQAIAAVRPLLKRNSIILIKGSHGMRMDKIAPMLEEIG